jgi:outer membrane immunogenic protein
MRHLSVAVAAVAFTIAFTQIAMAAPPSPNNWTGWYAGLNAGYGWGNGNIDNSATLGICNFQSYLCPWFAEAVPGQIDTNPNGFIGGGQIGYNFQSGAFVWGLETDFQGADIKGDASIANSVTHMVQTSTITIPLTAKGSQKIDLLGTLRGRLGWTPFNSLLIYATGGLAYGHVQTDVSFSGLNQHVVCPTCIPGPPIPVPSGAPTAASESDTLAGWTVGGGVEWMFAPQWSVKAEYLYYDLGTVTLNQTDSWLRLSTNSVEVLIRSSAHYNGNIVRAGLNYRF